MARNKFALATVGLVAAGALGLGGTALANAATGDTTTTPSVTSSAAPSASTDANGTSGTKTGKTGAAGQAGKAGHTHTAVTGDELAKVKAAVTAKDSTITVETVRKDADGSYDVDGTKAGAKVRLDVSADLATITENAGGPGGKGGKGGSQDTPVTGDELAKVKAAVSAAKSGLTIAEVRKDPDGSYDVLGTENGAKAMYDVSADLKTVTAGPAAGQGGRGDKMGGPAGNKAGSQSGTTTSKSPAVAATPSA